MWALPDHPQILRRRPKDGMFGHSISTSYSHSGEWKSVESYAEGLLAFKLVCLLRKGWQQPTFQLLLSCFILLSTNISIFEHVMTLSKSFIILRLNLIWGSARTRRLQPFRASCLNADDRSGVWARISWCCPKSGCLERTCPRVSLSPVSLKEKAQM